MTRNFHEKYCNRCKNGPSITCEIERANFRSFLTKAALCSALGVAIVFAYEAVNSLEQQD